MYLVPRDERTRRSIEGVLEIAKTKLGVCQDHCRADGRGSTDESCRWQYNKCGGDQTEEEVNNADAKKEIDA